jgi:multimeric flavodoxin WrbA
MHNITCIFASPRANGNSATIAKYLIDHSKDKTASIQKYMLGDMNLSGCRACYGCKQAQDKCVLDDDISAVLESVRASDVVFIASPVYWGEVSAQLKTFIDRCFSFLVPDYVTNKSPSRLSKGKKLILVLTQGTKEPGNLSQHYLDTFNFIGFSETHLIHACNVRNIGDIEKRQDIFQEAKTLIENVL